MTAPHDCGHVCCDERSDPLHDHFLGPESCPTCASRRTDTRPFLGVIAYEAVDTVDGRFLIPGSLRWDAPPPVLVDPRTRTKVGYLNRISRGEAGTIRAEGITTLPPGDYPVGIEVDGVDIEEATADRLTIKSARIAGLVVYRDGQPPAWPDAAITVADPEALNLGIVRDPSLGANQGFDPRRGRAEFDATLLGRDAKPEPVGQHVADSNEPGRPFADLMSSGLLWLINASVFHPRGLALSISLDPDGNAAGWQLLAADAGEAYRYAVPCELDDPSKAVDVDDLYRRATATMEQARLTAWGA